MLVRSPTDEVGDDEPVAGLSSGGCRMRSRELASAARAFLRKEVERLQKELEDQRQQQDAECRRTLKKLEKETATKLEKKDAVVARLKDQLHERNLTALKMRSSLSRTVSIPSFGGVRRSDAPTTRANNGANAQVEEISPESTRGRNARSHSPSSRDPFGGPRDAGGRIAAAPGAAQGAPGVPRRQDTSLRAETRSLTPPRRDTPTPSLAGRPPPRAWRRQPLEHQEEGEACLADNRGGSGPDGAVARRCCGAPGSPERRSVARARWIGTGACGLCSTAARSSARR